MATILIVEDEQDIQNILRDLLTSEGYQTITVADGVEALEAVRRQEPDLILLDLAMPRKDGWTVAREIRAEGRRVPIIGVTAHAMRGDDQKARAAGCDSYLSKPFDSNAVLKEVARLLGPKP